MNKTILHIDFDSFFASVEQQYNPSLRDKPIGVTAANGRTCIIASSREAKRYGVKTGTRSYDAQQMCPQITLVSADFIKYWEVSKKFIAICKDFSPYVEVFSIDELFMNVTATHHLFGGVYALVTQIKSRITKEIGEYITVSVGISHNKLLAKLASGLKKPNGVMEIRKEDVDAVYGRARLTDICGIGKHIKLRLHARGIYTLLQLRSAPFTILLSEFGKAEALFLQQVGLGIDPRPVEPYTVKPSVKSIGRNYCLPRNEYGERVILQNIYELCEEIAIKLRRLGKKARTVGIAISGSSHFHGRKTFGTYFDLGKELFKAVSLILSSGSVFIENGYVRQISVWVENLEDAACLPLSLFEAAQRKTRLMETVDKLNDKFGHHTIRNGFLLYADKLTTVPNGYMVDKYERTLLTRV